MIAPYHRLHGSGGAEPWRLHAGALSPMSHVAEEARALGLRLLSRRWDDPPHTISGVDAAVAELARLRRAAVDSDDIRALQDVLAAFAEVRQNLDS